jgi:hypothetical protein
MPRQNMDAIYIHGAEKAGQEIRIPVCDKLLVSVDIIVQRNRKGGDIERWVQNVEE